MSVAPISYHTPYHCENATAAMNTILKCEKHGVPEIWLGALPFGVDPMVIIAAAAGRTEKIGLGTSIVTTYPRHPAILANEASAIAELFPGRLNLGIGSGHGGVIEGMYGLSYGKPLRHLREYMTVLRALLWEGEVHFEGEYYRVHGQLVMGDREASLEDVLDNKEAYIGGAAKTAKVPLPISAVQPGMFRLAGEISDGAMTAWCPKSYLLDTAVPAMEEGAQKAGRDKPPLVAHTPIVFSNDFEKVRQAAFNSLRMAPSVPTGYMNVWAKSGFKVEVGNPPPDDLVEDLMIYGTPEAIADQVTALRQSGLDALMIDVHAAEDPFAEEDAVIGMIGELSAA